MYGIRLLLLLTGSWCLLVMKQEGWCISEKPGEKAWFLQSEKMYYQHHKAYYNNIRKLGWEFETLDYKKALDFLLMLPQSFEI